MGHLHINSRMRYHQIMSENFRVITTDDRANRLRGDYILDDVDTDKVMVKWSPGYRGTDEILAVFPLEDDVGFERQEFYLILYGSDHTFDYREGYNGEVIPVAKFILSRWPSYADFTHEGDMTFRDLAGQDRPRLATNTAWFHGTSSVKVANIMRLGMIPQSIDTRLYRGLGGSLDKVVYLSSDQEISKMHAENAVRQFGGAPTVLQIDLAGLEDQIVTDQDVRATPLGKPSGDVDRKRIQQRPGEASYLTIGTIAFRGRIPPNRIRIVYQGKERKQKPIDVSKAGQLEFIQALSRLAETLSKDELTAFFGVIAAKPGGWSGGRVTYPDRYYADVARTIYSVYGDKRQPARFAQWLRGMRIRSGAWRRGYDDKRKAIAALIDKENRALTESVDDPTFRAWFANSQVVDETGAPLVVYHGTPHAFDTFDTKRNERDRGYFGVGAYFSSSKAVASSYGQNVYPAYLSLQRPKMVHLASFIDYQQWCPMRYPGMSQHDVTAAMEFEGHDGVIISVAHETVREFVAFHPEQIRRV